MTAEKTGDVGLEHGGPHASERLGFNQRAMGSHSRSLSRERVCLGKEIEGKGERGRNEPFLHLGLLSSLSCFR